MAGSNRSENQTASDIQKVEDDSCPDIAMDDFPTTPQNIAVTNKPELTSTGAEEADTVWSHMMGEALKSDPNISELFGEGGAGLIQKLTKISESLTKVIEISSSKNVADFLSERINSFNFSNITQSLLENSDKLETRLLELGLDWEVLWPKDTPEDVYPFLLNMMQQILSKDVFYPFIKHFVKNYSALLESKKDSILGEEYESYSKKLDLMKKVVEEYETETDTDSEEVKNQRFQRIMGCLQHIFYNNLM